MLDKNRVELLGEEILVLVKRHYTADAGNVWEALNALGSCAGTLLLATGPDQRAVDFFNQAVANEMRGDKALQS